MDFYLGYVSYYAFNYAPQGWAQCNGQTLQITTNQALFSLLGVMYGGDGRTTFALPDLRGRTIVGMGQRSGGPVYIQGAKAGAESVALAVTNMPAHTHSTLVNVPVNAANGDEQFPFTYLSQPANGAKMFAAASTANAFYAPLGITIQSTGASAPVPLLSPYQVLNACICISGLYPSRN